MRPTPQSIPHGNAAGASEVPQTLAKRTCKPLIAYQNRLSPRAVLVWLERDARELLIQDIKPGRRRKNRCVVQFADASGDVRAVGGYSIADAVWRAQIRLQAAFAAREKHEAS